MLRYGAGMNESGGDPALFPSSGCGTHAVFCVPGPEEV